MIPKADTIGRSAVRRIIGGRRGLFAFALAAFGALATVPAVAHNLPLNALMTAFVKVDRDDIHLVIRIPLELLTRFDFPVTGAGIDLVKAEPVVEEALGAIGRSITIADDQGPLAPSSVTARLSLPSDHSFDEYDKAVAKVAASTAPDTEIYPGQGYLDAHLTYRVRSPYSVIDVRTTFAPELKDYLKLSVRYLSLDGTNRVILMTSQSGHVALNPTWGQVVRGFVAIGLGRVVVGTDYLLLLFCLILPLRRARDLVPVVAALAVGHFTTLIGAAFGFAPTGFWFAPFVATALAASMVYVALENIAGPSIDRRWMVAGLFGLVHGFAFSAALNEQLQFAGSYPLVSLFAFSLGNEIGQLAALTVMLIGLYLVWRGPVAGRMVIVLLSLIIAHTAWHSMVDRGQLLWQVQWPRLDELSLFMLARWLAGLFVVVSTARLLAQWIARKWPEGDGTADGAVS